MNYEIVDGKQRECNSGIEYAVLQQFRLDNQGFKQIRLFVENKNTGVYKVLHGSEVIGTYIGYYDLDKKCAVVRKRNMIDPVSKALDSIRTKIENQKNWMIYS